MCRGNTQEQLFMFFLPPLGIFHVDQPNICKHGSGPVLTRTLTRPG